ncbi:hypothetical protein M758_2G203700 [Ceratodon purpureus]|nr:hypothetical protein M758_2G203700 [Ceratodon purpureus]
MVRNCPRTSCGRQFTGPRLCQLMTNTCSNILHSTRPSTGPGSYFPTLPHFPGPTLLCQYSTHAYHAPPNCERYFITLVRLQGFGGYLSVCSKPEILPFF